MEEKEARGKEVLDSIEKKIHSIERKSAMLAVGVVIAFAIALSFLINPSLALLTSRNGDNRAMYGIFLAILSILTILSILFLVLAIYPSKKDEDKARAKTVEDYDDVGRMSDEEIVQELQKEVDYVALIKKKAEVCRFKAEKLRAGIIFLIIFVISLVILSMMAIFIQ